MGIGKTNFPPGGTDTSDATAVVADILATKTAYLADGAKHTGTMVNNGSLGTYTPGTTNQSIPSGYTSGGTVLGDSDLVAGNIAVGINIFGVNGSYTSDATATVGQILATVTAYVNGSKLTGTMPNNGALGTYTPTTTSQSIPAGYTSGGTVAGSANLTAANIQVGVSIFGVTGTYTNDATATAAHILASDTAYVNGSKITGTMTNIAADQTATSISNSTTTLKFLVPAGYYSGSFNVTSTDADFLAANIKNGVNIFGIAGSYSPSGSIINNNRAGEANDTTNSFLIYISVLQIKTSGIPVSIAASSDLLCIYFLDGSGNLYKTTNGGKSWTTTTVSASYKIVRCSADGIYLYLFGGSGINMAYSSNNGSSFTTHGTVNGWGDCSADGSIVYASVTTTIYKSTNYGVTMTSTGVSCYSTASWSSPIQMIQCSDDGQTVYYPAITTGYLTKSTNALGSAGSTVLSSGVQNANYTISQDGTKWGVYTNLSNGVTPANSYNVMAIFNNGNHILNSGSNIRCCAYANNTYWSSLSTVLPTNGSSDLMPRIKGLDVYATFKSSVLYVLGN